MLNERRIHEITILARLAAYKVLGADLTPSWALSKDVHGYSHDATFSEGRVTSRLGLRAEWSKRYFVEAAYTHFAGGDYNLLADRSNLALVAGAAF